MKAMKRYAVTVEVLVEARDEKDAEDYVKMLLEMGEVEVSQTLAISEDTLNGVEVIA